MSGDYTFIESIGQGMYGQVFKAINNKENKYYAIKRLNFKDINEKEKKQINNEVSLIKNLNHPNVISYKDSFNDQSNYFNIVTKFCEGGDIYSKIQKQKEVNDYFNEEQILNWFVQILLGLNYIHKNGIIHRDIKPQNIFILNKHIICIGDFGIAKIINQIQTQTMTSIIGTPLYMSPESFNEPNKKNFASDIWSTGCCLYEICNLKHAFGADRWESVFYKVREGKHAPVNKKYSKDLITIIESMLSVNPMNRPTIPNLLKSSFLKPKVANYINDFKKNYKAYDGNEQQVLILEEQAEEFGIFKNKINIQIKEASVEKDKKIKKNNNYKLNRVRRDSSNPISPEKEEKPKKYSLDKNNKRNKMYDYDISNKNKMKNKNIDNFLNNKNRQGDYTSDDNKKKHNNKDNISPNLNNNCHRIKSNYSNNIKRTAGRPLTSQKNGKNYQIGLEHNISIINKREKNDRREDEINYNKNMKNKNGNKIQKNDDSSTNNIKFLNKCDFMGLNEITNENENDNNNYSKQKILNDRINYFKNKCINNLKEDKYLEAYNYLVKIKINNHSEINNREIREHLIKILGKENIGYWHLIDQILLFESLLNNRQ